MSRDVLIGVDAGTSVIKAVAFDLRGRELALASVPNRVTHVAEGGVEQDMNWTWQATAETLRALAARVDGLAKRTAAVAFTGQGDGMWLLDRAGEPVAPAWLWLDGRAGDIVRRLRASDVGPRVSEITGTGLNPANQSGQLLWMRDHRPDVLARADKAMHCKDWLYFKACGEIATDLSEGLFTFGDYRTLSYNRRVLELLDLQEFEHLLPELLDGSRHHGLLSESAARASGLLAGTPVVLAPLDVLCTVLGAGAYAPGADVGCTILGSTGIHLRLYHSVDEVRPQGQVGYVMPFPVPGTWVGFMSNMAATLNIDWALNLVSQALSLADGVAPSRTQLLARLEDKVRSAKPGALLFHPFICENGERGPFVEPAARAQLVGMTEGTGLFEIVRAVLEGISFAARDCHEALGPLPGEIRLCGGAAKSPIIRTILASVLGRPLRTSRREETGAAGAAIIAAVSLGHYGHISEALPTWVEDYLDESVQKPVPELRALYALLFPLYRQGYRSMFDFWHALDNMRKVH
jgi:erythritol kinase